MKKKEVRKLQCKEMWPEAGDRVGEQVYIWYTHRAQYQRKFKLVFVNEESLPG